VSGRYGWLIEICKRPSYRQVAEQLGTTVSVVKKVGARWD